MSLTVKLKLQVLFLAVSCHAIWLERNARVLNSCRLHMMCQLNGSKLFEKACLPVLKNNFTDVSMGDAYIIFETRTARSAAMGCSGTFLGGIVRSVCDTEKGFGVNAYEFEDSLFNDCITIGETRKSRLIEWPDCGGSHVEKATQMIVAGDHERSFKRLCYDRP